MSESGAKIRKLLVVEDDPGLQTQLKWAYDDYQVLIAGDHDAAIELLRAEEPEVVTLDLGLPPDPDGTREGFRTLSAILEAKPDTKVIVVSGHGERASALAAIASGAWDFYQKPINIVQRRAADPEQLGSRRDIALAQRHRAADRDAVGGFARAAQIEPCFFAPLRTAIHQIEVVFHHQLAIGHDHRALDSVFQLANIARPAALVDRLQGIGGKTAHRRVHRGRILMQEMPCQQHRVAGPFGERGDLHHHLGKPVIEVVAETLRRDHRVQVSMRRAHDAGIDRDRLAPADSFDRTLLQKAQQFDLQRQRNVADFVEEERPAIRQLDLAFGHFDCTGERALFMPEQFAFEQIFGDRGAVDRDKRPIAPPARFMQSARQQFLAGAARAEQHHTDVQIGDALNRPRDLLHFERAGDHPA